ncbi:DUF2971 domain-containing protein [Rhizobium leguminosarum]|uniref:DUF2971 domain-containing protein n=1 Tax=Rhizobium leguminosarum TaxID=384 RepID=UPI001C949D5E|nr:DUF2971 domain-containing protein [Rhizobium leguminosarum]MBY5582544.1 DUF2971 domain-containing protein [Rhizobium leguminosarum]
MRLYHFTSSAHALSNIENQRIKIAEIKDLNDPFDLRAPKLKSAKHRTKWSEWREEVGRKFGMVCFAPHWRNVTMWSHYADKHRGICLGFDVADSKVRRVDYDQKRPELDLSKPLALADLDPIMYRKSTDWEYEEEYRLWAELNHPVAIGNRQLYFEPFGDELKLAEVIVGPLCEVTRADIDRLLKHYQFKPVLLKARLAFNSFTIVTQRLGLK